MHGIPRTVTDAAWVEALERAEAEKAKAECTYAQCGGKPGPSHDGSPNCQSGSLASGGHRSHCTCDTCF